MKSRDKNIFVASVMISIFFLTAMNPSAAPAFNARLEVNKMGDMSDFDPGRENSLLDGP